MLWHDAFGGREGADYVESQSRDGGIRFVLAGRAFPQGADRSGGAGPAAGRLVSGAGPRPDEANRQKRALPAAAAPRQRGRAARRRSNTTRRCPSARSFP